MFLQPSSTPNFSLAPALDVLVLGAYPRLPSCIREKTVNPPPLSSQEQLGAFSLLDCAIRRRLGYESVPEAMKVTHIGMFYVIFCEGHLSAELLSIHVLLLWILSSAGKGLVTFIVPSEFEVIQSLLCRSH